LQAALREVVGDHIEQAGSEVTADRLRFDFTHHAPLTADQRRIVENLINDLIVSQHPVTIIETTLEEARQRGATALFGEKYGDTVRLVDIGGASVELCGGTHVKNTGEIGVFRILSEAGIASGVRRIEAETSHTALLHYQYESGLLSVASEILKVQPAALPDKLKALLSEIKELKKEAARLQAAASGEQQEQALASILANAETHNGLTLIAAKLENYDIEALRTLSDKLKAQLKSGCILLCGTNDGAAMFLCSATDDAVKAGINCGNIIKTAATICGGGGGGRPNHAQAGGKDATKADEALKQGLAAMKESIPC
jgi:alanyl-tRNA synthetase